MLNNIPRFDMRKKPSRMHLRPLMWVAVLPSLLIHRNRLTKIGMEGVRPPYLLLCNHNAFMDMSVAVKATFPHRANFVVAIDGFIGREWLLRLIGCICKRKFTRDAQLVKQLRRVIKNGDIAAVYPEARYSLCGTTAVLPASLGKLCKFLNVPVVTLICHGHHINTPFWNLHDRKVRTEATMQRLLTAEETQSLPAEEISRRIKDAFQYDDFAWQAENQVRVRYKGRAQGLHKVLYQCPHCGKEYRMNSLLNRLFCEACGKTWEMDEYGRLTATEGETEFSHIPDWYEWERMNVRREVESGTYHFSGPCHVNALPNSKGYISLGSATLTHDMDGFTVSGEYLVRGDGLKAAEIVAGAKIKEAFNKLDKGSLTQRKDSHQTSSNDAVPSSRNKSIIVETETLSSSPTANSYTEFPDLTPAPYEVHLAAKSHYSVHIEYEYLGKFGDCVDLNTQDDTLYVYPELSPDGHADFSVTKMALATEELYQYYNHREG